jgi:wobble nucleotide-excising tRNase
MIGKILEIKNLGVFKDFKWNRNPKLQEFKEKNIIYGSNYSGKPTISRIFSS